MKRKFDKYIPRWEITDHKYVSTIKDALFRVLSKDVLNIVLEYTNDINMEKHALAMKLIRYLPIVCIYPTSTDNEHYRSKIVKKWNDFHHYRKISGRIGDVHRPDRIMYLCETVNQNLVDAAALPIDAYGPGLLNVSFYTVLTNYEPSKRQLNGWHMAHHQGMDCTVANTTHRLRWIWKQVLEERANQHEFDEQDS